MQPTSIPDYGPDFKNLSQEALKLRYKDQEELQHPETYQEAAQQGDPLAQLALADSLVFQKNPKEAFPWYLLSAQQGNMYAQFILGLYYRCGAADVAVDHRAAQTWFLRSAEQGYPMAQNLVGFILKYPVEGEGDLKSAFDWYLKAAERGLAKAQCNVGRAYANGHGVDIDHGVAIEWYRKAAAQGSAVAQNALGCHYDCGEGVEQNEGEAFVWFLKAAKQGLTYGHYNVGQYYMVGKGRKKSWNKAAKWFRGAACVDKDAASKLGQCYEDGADVGLKESIAYCHRVNAGAKKATKKRKRGNEKEEKRGSKECEE